MSEKMLMEAPVSCDHNWTLGGHVTEGEEKKALLVCSRCGETRYSRPRQMPKQEDVSDGKQILFG